jgi:hypothetical protein
MFGENMALGRSGRHPGFPLWFLEDANKNWPAGKTLFDSITSVARNVGAGGTLILSSENLSQLGMPRLFAGIDSVLDTHVVFYMRPQTDWIPSAWKQWASKTGVPIGVFIDNCLKHGHPANASIVDGWRNALPRAKITIRPFFRDVMKQGNPAIDFFELIGFGNYKTDRLQDQANPSIDYSLMHVLMLNAKSNFDDIHDNRLSDALAAILPERYKRANIAMLSKEAAERIERHYRDENLHVLKTYCGLSEDFYNSHYSVKAHSESYMEKPDAEMVQRAFDILAELKGGEWAARFISTTTKAEG